MKAPALAALLLLLPAALLAQTTLSHERGFSPERSYQLGEVDSVGLLNGNVTVTIPIGGSYPVSPSFSYRLTLVYNS